MLHSLLVLPLSQVFPVTRWTPREVVLSGVWLQTGTLGGCLWAGFKPDLGLLPVIF